MWPCLHRKRTGPDAHRGIRPERCGPCRRSPRTPPCAATACREDDSRSRSPAGHSRCGTWRASPLSPDASACCRSRAGRRCLPAKAECPWRVPGCRRAAGLPTQSCSDFNVDFDGVGMASDRRGQNRGLGQSLALGLQGERSVAGLEARRIKFVPEAPLQAKLRRGEVVRWIEVRLLGLCREWAWEGSNRR